MTTSWSKLKEWEFFSPVAHPQSARSPEVQAAFEKHKARLKADNVSLESHIRKTVLEPSNGLATVMEKNAFPYDVEDGVEHYVLWTNPEAPQTLTQTLPSPFNTYPADKIAIVKNSKSSQSVPGLPHCHVFVRI